MMTKTIYALPMRTSAPRAGTLHPANRAGSSRWVREGSAAASRGLAIKGGKSSLKHSWFFFVSSSADFCLNQHHIWVRPELQHESQGTFSLPLGFSLARKSEGKDQTELQVVPRPAQHCLCLKFPCPSPWVRVNLGRTHCYRYQPLENLQRIVVILLFFCFNFCIYLFRKTIITKGQVIKTLKISKTGI